MKQNRLAFLLLLNFTLASTSQFDFFKKDKNHHFRSTITRWSLSQNKPDRKEDSKQRENYQDENEAKHRRMFRQHLEPRLVASAVLRDFYAGRF
jgi:hypothetical protein